MNGGRKLGSRRDATTAGGTLRYVSPEMLSGRPADEAADIWSLCVVEWLRHGGQLELWQMRQRSNCVRWCRAGSDRPAPARRGSQRTLPQGRASAYRRGVGPGPWTRRSGVDTPRAVVPPSSRLPGRRPVLSKRILAPARLRLRCDAA